MFILGLQLCHKCQETVERQRRIDDSSSIENKLPRSCERISRVLMFMDNYPERVDVLTAGMDAVILFARNGLVFNNINSFFLFSLHLRFPIYNLYFYNIFSLKFNSNFFIILKR